MLKTEVVSLQGTVGKVKDIAEEALCGRRNLPSDLEMVEESEENKEVGLVLEVLTIPLLKSCLVVVRK